MRAMRVGSLVIASVVSGVSLAGVRINEVLGSTAAEDCEFIELYNTGRSEVDLAGWTLELWDSDADKAFGTPDGDSPIRLGGRIDAGGFYLLANPEFREHHPILPDQDLRANAIENSSYTIVLRDDLGEIVESIFVSDGDADDKANINGRVIEPDAVILSPQGRFVPPGFARLADDAGGKRVYTLLKFSPVPSSDATPGKPNRVRAPGAAPPDAPEGVPAAEAGDD